MDVNSSWYAYRTISVLGLARDLGSIILVVPRLAVDRCTDGWSLVLNHNIVTMRPHCCFHAYRTISVLDLARDLVSIILVVPWLVVDRCTDGWSLVLNHNIVTMRHIRQFIVLGFGPGGRFFCLFGIVLRVKKIRQLLLQVLYKYWMSPKYPHI